MNYFFVTKVLYRFHEIYAYNLILSIDLIDLKNLMDFVYLIRDKYNKVRQFGFFLFFKIKFYFYII